MLKAQGKGMIFSPDPYIEYETMTCAHCQKIMPLAAGQGPKDVGGVCTKCNSVICPECVTKVDCVSWWEK